jgi:hypothetical protein
MTRRTMAVLTGVCIAAVINYAISGMAGDGVFNAGRVVVSFVGGWIVVSQARASLWVAASVGPLVMLIDHVLLKGGYFIVAHYAWPEQVQNQGLLAAGGVAVSYVMFLPLASLCSWAGGFTARRRRGVRAHP